MNREPGQPAAPPDEPFVAAAPGESDDRVLATLNADGSRRWLRPRLSHGRFLTRRRAVAWALIALFTALPYIEINGKPAMLLDIVHRRFTLFGTTFLPTDTVIFAALLLIVFLGIFLVTAVFGRIWCGWACPQTVYMEFLYRPIERFFEGAPGSARARGPVPAWRRVAKHAAFFAASCFLAHNFLAYFVGVDALRHWVTQSPLEHPTAFIVMAAVTGLMLFDFGYFREQTCLVACPYGRFQSAMLDRHSLIVSYDRRRGEPRGKATRAPQAPDRADPADVRLRVLPAEGERRGDCVDCGMCVATCPTGIDIREGLQMECIGCAQCIDACDAVMDKLHRPRGLIGYASRAMHEGEARTILRPRVILYPAILAGLIGLFVYLLATKPLAEAAALPRQGAPFYTLPSGEIANQVRLRIVNRGEDDAIFTVAVPPEEAARGVRVIFDAQPPRLAPMQSDTVGVALAAPTSAFSERGALMTAVTVSTDTGYTRTIPFRMLGPASRTPGTPAQGRPTADPGSPQP